MANEKTVTVRNAVLRFRNFEGREEKFNRQGDRNFAVMLPEDVATQMEADGWNIKWLDPRDEGDSPQPYIQVAVSFKNRPPRITMITSGGRTVVKEEMLEVLDYAEFEKVDLIMRGYDWHIEATGKSGTKAYLQTLFATLREDELEREYAIMEREDAYQGGEFGE